MGGILLESRIRELFCSELAAVRQEVSQMRGQLVSQSSQAQEAMNALWRELRSQRYFTAGKFRPVPEG